MTNVRLQNDKNRILLFQAKVYVFLRLLFFFHWVFALIFLRYRITAASVAAARPPHTKDISFVMLYHELSKTVAFYCLLTFFCFVRLFEMLRAVKELWLDVLVFIIKSGVHLATA